ncbi:MAG: AMP-binding protein [Marinilabiliaceae bacterium]|jgi:acyl-CoA synthetase (AMP-forming)/AMP-acid ligase II|nr:AMP-binding protein [Marinilabiliaceae bacterium]
MNAVDYFFENTSTLEKNFLVGREEISYKDLYNDVIGLAAWLNENYGKEKNIFILSVNNLFFLKTYLAIIKSGNVCIPLDPATEKDNFAYIHDLTKPDLIFITPEVNRRLQLNEDNLIFPDTLPEPGTKNHEPVTRNHEPVTRTEESKTTSSAKPNHEPGIFDSERCAELIFTSGSTGKPKGVILSHKNLIANTRSIVEYLELKEDDRMLVVLPFYYCYGLSLLHTHLRVGGSIVFNNSFIFLGAVINDLKNHECTGFAGIPSHFQILLRKSDTFKETAFPYLKYVTQAGGKLAPIFIDEFREAHPETKFIVMYGQTEATARLSWLPPDIYLAKRGSIGKGIPNVELKVVNADGEPVKPGETGEVIARGDNIMSGYFHDPEGTAQALRRGWLYTGDLGTVDEEGYIFLTARSKEIIKVRGKRISPKEIEAVILAINGVIDVTIQGVEDDIEGEALKADIVIRKEMKGLITEQYVMDHCSKHLAMFKIPRFYDIHDNLTITATGKKIKKS